MTAALAKVMAHKTLTKTLDAAFSLLYNYNKTYSIYLLPSPCHTTVSLHCVTLGFHGLQPVTPALFRRSGSPPRVWEKPEGCEKQNVAEWLAVTWRETAGHRGAMANIMLC